MRSPFSLHEKALWMVAGTTMPAQRTKLWRRFRNSAEPQTPQLRMLLTWTRTSRSCGELRDDRFGRLDALVANASGSGSGSGSGHAHTLDEGAWDRVMRETRRGYGSPHVRCSPTCSIKAVDPSALSRLSRDSVVSKTCSPTQLPKGRDRNDPINGSRLRAPRGFEQTPSVPVPFLHRW
jgi:hypothetical protein